MQKAREAANSRREGEWENIGANSVCQKSRRKGSEKTQNLANSAAFLNQYNLGSRLQQETNAHLLTLVSINLLFFLRTVATPFLTESASCEIRNGSRNGTATTLTSHFFMNKKGNQCFSVFWQKLIHDIKACSSGTMKLLTGTGPGKCPCPARSSPSQPEWTSTDGRSQPRSLQTRESSIRAEAPHTEHTAVNPQAPKPRKRSFRVCGKVSTKQSFVFSKMGKTRIDQKGLLMYTLLL